MSKIFRKIMISIICATIFVSCGGTGNKGTNGNSSSIILDNSSEYSSSSEAANYVTITYDANGGKFEDGSKFEELEVEKGSLLTAPTAPSRTGYSFAGWSQSKNSTNLWKFGTNIIENDLTLYAVWNEESAVILSVDGASIDSSTNKIFMVVDQDTDSVSLSNKVVCSSDSTWKLYYDKLGQTEIPTKIAAGMSGALQNGENVFYVVVTSSDGNTVNVYTLTIHRSYIIHFTYSFQAVTLKTESLPSGYETELTYTPDIKGYTFNYWMDIEDHKVTKITPYESMSFYANAIANKYTITLDANQGEVSIDSKIVTFDSEYSLPVPTRTGYSFAGWYNGSTQLTDIKGKSLNKWTIANDKTLTAKWTANEYVLSLINSNEEAGSITGNGTYAYDSNVTIRAISNNGSSFAGWYNSNGTCVSNEAIYTFKMGLSNTLTAKWDYDDVTLNYVLNGEVIHTETYTLNNHIISLYQYETDNYFDGWYKSKTFNSHDTIVISTKGLAIDSNNNSYLYGTTLETQFDFIYGNGGYTITSYNDSKKCVEIPSQINGIATKKISAKAFENCSEITSVCIPNSVTSIGDCAFYNCTSLTSVTFEEGSKLRDIEGNAFSCCSSLTSIVIPNSVTSIGSYAFSECSSLTSITIPNSVTSIGDGAFSGCSLLIIYCEASSKPSGWSSDNWSPWNGESRQEYWGINENNYLEQDGLIFVFENGNAVVTGHIGDISNVVIPSTITINGTTNSVVSIESYALYGCSSLTSIVIPSSVTSIGDSAFGGCSSLTSIVIPNSVTSIGSYAFSGCSSLTSIVIPNSVTRIGSYAFYECSSLTSIIIPNSVTSIEFGAFSMCNALTSLTLPFIDSILGIYFGVHSYANHSTSVPNSLKEVIITGGWEIPQNAFTFCSSLTSIVIPNSVTRIGSYAFDYCDSLTIYCEASSKPSGWESNWNPENKPVYWGINENNYLIQDGLIYVVKNDNAIVTGHTNELSNNVDIPSTITINDVTYNVTSIGNCAFENCSSLTSIVIPSSVTSIGDSAFENCSSLTSIVIPSSVTSIGDSAFRGCSSLTSVTFEEGSKLRNIEDYAFSFCSSLTSIVIPNSVTRIGSYAFDYCDSLTIYCEASSKPSGWESNWNGENKPVYWGEEWSYVDGVPTPNK